MNPQGGNIVEKLRMAVKSADFTELAYQSAEDLRTQINAHEAIVPIIRLMEENPKVDFGNPGPLVHFMEKYDAETYDIVVLESIQRKPTVFKLFLFSRIINSVDEVKRQGYIRILKQLSEEMDTCDDVKTFANELIAHHIGISTDFIPTIETCDVVLIHPLPSPKDLLNLKKIMGINTSIAELLKCSKEMPYTLLENIPVGKARKMLMEASAFEKYIKLR